MFNRNDCVCTAKKSTSSNRRAMIAIALAGLTALISHSCNNPFDPRGPVDDNLVVFTVLSTDHNTQFVSVTAPFVPSGFGTSEYYSSDLSVSDAIVRISGPGENYHLRDTILSRPDTSHFTSPLRLFTVRPFTPQYGAKYTVSVSSSSHGTAATSVVMPGRPTLEMGAGTYFVLMHPREYASDRSIEFLVKLSDLAKGYVARLFVDFDVLVGVDWVRDRVQMPISSADTNAYSIKYPTYPHLNECASSNQFAVSFKTGYLKSIIDNSRVRYPANLVVYRQVVVQLLQADPNLYSYYVAAQVDRDPYSIRLDQPLYPKISGGSYGMVGGYTLDSLVFVVPGQ
jgi:hypothetical protein